MLRRSLLVGTVSLLGSMLAATTALAHHPEVSAGVVCDANLGAYVINYTSTAWTAPDPTDLGRENTRIDIFLNGFFMESGAYTFPTYSFSGSALAPVTGGNVTVTAVAVDAWGNGYAGGQSDSVVVVIPDDPCGETPALGRFTGGGHQLHMGNVRVTRGFTIHCDLLLSNNLEVNWQGNQFHMNEHLTTVQCSDDPLIIQAPPPAPVDTIVGVGIGRFNGTQGNTYTIEFTLVDAGEPGTNDQAALRIYETTNPTNVVLDVPLQFISGGNIQAHFDQPHK